MADSATEETDRKSSGSIEKAEREHRESGGAEDGADKIAEIGKAREGRWEERMEQATEQRQYIGKYEVLRQLGQGGEGNVYLARDAALNRLVAVKKLQKQQEADLLDRLRHPMLPVVYELFCEDSWYMVMEYIQGATLREHVERNGYVQEEHACAWTDQLLDVLGYFHSRKPPVIYRDLKPENIMVCPDGHLRLVDFGAAFRRKFGMVSDSLMAATPGYGAPEQFGRTGNGIRADERSDIYALGKVLYYMVTGADPVRPPYTSLSIRDYQPLLGSRLEQVIQNCIEEEPAKRYQTVGQIREELGRCGRRNSRLRRRSFIRVVEKQVWLTEK